MIAVKVTQEGIYITWSERQQDKHTSHAFELNIHEVTSIRHTVGILVYAHIIARGSGHCHEGFAQERILTSIPALCLNILINRYHVFVTDVFCESDEFFGSILCN